MFGPPLYFENVAPFVFFVFPPVLRNPADEPAGSWL